MRILHMTKPTTEELDKLQFGKVLHRRPSKWRDCERCGQLTRRPSDGQCIVCDECN